MAPVNFELCRQSQVRRKWAGNQCVFCVAVHLTDPSVCEMVSLMDFDCIWVDMEHHATSVQTAGEMFRAARVNGSDIMARPGKGEFMRMGRMLESGATGILYPRCDDPAEAREVVKWGKFAPLGQRGLDAVNADSPFGLTDIAGYVERANRETWLAVQIESPQAVCQADAIAAVDGIDMLCFGPGDYSLLSGRPGDVKCSEVTAAAAAVCSAAKKAGKKFGTPALGPDHAKRMIDMGANFLTLGSDISLLRSAMQNLRRQYGL